MIFVAAERILWFENGQKSEKSAGFAEWERDICQIAGWFGAVEIFIKSSWKYEKLLMTPPFVAYYYTGIWDKEHDCA